MLSVIYLLLVNEFVLGTKTVINLKSLKIVDILHLITTHDVKVSVIIWHAPLNQRLGLPWQAQLNTEVRVNLCRIFKTIRKYRF